MMASIRNNRLTDKSLREQTFFQNNKKDTGIIFFPDITPLDEHDYFVEENSFVFFIKGKNRFSIDKSQSKDLNGPSLLLLSKGMCFHNVALTASSFFIVPVKDNTIFSFLSLSKDPNNALPFVDKGYALSINKEVNKYLELLKELILLGIMDVDYLDLKLTELIYIIDKTYSEKEKGHFFSVILNEDFFFSSLIRDQHKQARSVKELAVLTCYSVSGFEKKFKKIFGESASQWLKSQKKKEIYHDLIKSNKTFKEISSEYGFCSTTHFNNYCKTFLGETPGKIRKNSFFTVPD